MSESKTITWSNASFCAETGLLPIALIVVESPMSLIQFTRNYDDLSTDRGYQFKFYCDKCGNGYMTHFETSALGMAQSLLNAAGNIFTNIGYRAGNAAMEVQRAIGGKAHD